MELLDRKWFEKFFYLHVLPFCRAELGTVTSVWTLSRDGSRGNILIGKPGAWQARTVN
jgi:hypothetical protein